MDKKENQPREKKGMPLAPVFLLGATVLLLIEMYFIVNLPRVYLVQIILGAAILACTYVFIAALLKEIHKSGEQAKDEYERMLRGEKASYLMLKKISEHVDTNNGVTVNQNGDWSNIGVVVKGNNEQSYIGISIRIKGRK